MAVEDFHQRIEVVVVVVRRQPLMRVQLHRCDCSSIELQSRRVCKWALVVLLESMLGHEEEERVERVVECKRMIVVVVVEERHNLN